MGRDGVDGGLAGGKWELCGVSALFCNEKCLEIACVLMRGQVLKVRFGVCGVSEAEFRRE